MSTIDHRAEAQKHYEEAVEANQNGKWETARFEMQLAKFHIEAASVEQQRIANLIAVATAESDLLKALPGSSPFATVFTQIREGLGLS